MLHSWSNFQLPKKDCFLLDLRYGWVRPRSGWLLSPWSFHSLSRALSWNPWSNFWPRQLSAAPGKNIICIMRLPQDSFGKVIGTTGKISSKLITALQLAWIKWTDVTDYHYTVLRPRSTRTSCLIILLVMVMPLFNLWAYPEEVCGQGRKGIGLVLSIQGGCLLPCSKCSQNHSRSNFTKDGAELQNGRSTFQTACFICRFGRWLRQFSSFLVMSERLQTNRWQRATWTGHNGSSTFYYFNVNVQLMCSSDLCLWRLYWHLKIAINTSWYAWI